MPKPKAGEKQQDYVSRAMPMMMKEGMSKEQAAGKAHGMFRSHKRRGIVKIARGK